MNDISRGKDEAMHDSCFYENETKHEATIFEIKRVGKGKGCMITTILTITLDFVCNSKGYV